MCFFFGRCHFIGRFRYAIFKYFHLFANKLYIQSIGNLRHNRFCGFSIAFNVVSMLTVEKQCQTIATFVWLLDLLHAFQSTSMSHYNLRVEQYWQQKCVLMAINWPFQVKAMDLVLWLL